MPLYEYQCEGCGGQYELLVRGTEEIRCPQCHSQRLVRMLSVTAPPISAAGRVERETSWQGCGRPECGQGRCAGLESL
ncbi:MAG: zinc ribbon domain-containing protein [Pirellulales bacterium]|jgi:putative FmdB family regulatory protein|nr:zinc ribbon domain-containing protein [Pirellulales bacterium]